MKRSPHRIRVELAEIESFLNNALACKRSIAVDQNHQTAPAIGIACTILFCAHPPERDWIHKFQMAWIETERQMNLAAGNRLPVGAITQVILHIAVTVRVEFRIEIGEFAKDLAGTLRHDIRENIQAPAMRHSEDNFIDAVLSGSLNCQIQERNEALCSFE